MYGRNGVNESEPGNCNGNLEKSEFFCSLISLRSSPMLMISCDRPYPFEPGFGSFKTLQYLDHSGYLGYSPVE